MKTRVLVFLVCISVLMSCGQKKTGSSGDGSGRGPQTAEELTIGIYDDAGSVTTWGGGSYSPWVLDAINEKLAGPNPYGPAPKMILAEYIRPVTDDNLVWEIKLKPGIKWHDGTPLTSADVKFTIDYNREGPSNNRYSHHTSSAPRLPGEGITVIDDLTLRVAGAYPMPYFDREPCAELPIVQKAQWENIQDPRQFTGKSIGTGPYKLVDYKVGEYYKLEANADYHLGKPLVNKLNLVVIRDFSTMFTALRSGEIDGAARNLPPEMVEEWSKVPNVTIVKTPYLWGACITLDTTKLPFGDLAFREAISYAINRDELLRIVGLGRGITGTVGYPHPRSFHTSPNNSQPYDPEKAAQLFTELGYVDRNGDGLRETPEGNPINWRILVDASAPLYVRAAEIITEHLGAINLKAHVEALESAAYSEAVNVTGNYNMTVGEFVPHGLADDDMMMVLLFGEQKNDIVPFKERDEAMVAWEAAVSGEERLAASHYLQGLLNKHPRRIMLWYPDGFFAYNNTRYDNYSVIMGENDIFHKYSFIPNEARKGYVLENFN
ncbi:putative extracellular solute-binding protein, family 5 [Treponema primitia ZAS-2]|uniref:Putative extracellular solute-binding protein, family 5 n=1 Tax=Treponema primitia (strain ATCC BAA-887 / DSM 12427 / ZAS-2) TaxID=545694 RepID=F5YIC7_TREPZ|nr:ABC transporter substrate-binding protein [Treponema primitia]AEF86451.1 putative extracellular solute-binding protein, family 5 [Treponema primitia ZAS-2]